ALGDITAPGPLLALVGTLITGALLALRVRGAILWGILGTTVLGMMFRPVPLPTSIVQVPRFSDWAPVVGKLDIPGALQLGLFEIILVFLFVDMFDTVGTLIGVSARAGFPDEHGRLPRARQALMADAIGTWGGAVCGTPPVTTYVEAARGAAAGRPPGRSAVRAAARFPLRPVLPSRVGRVAAGAVGRRHRHLGRFRLRHAQGHHVRGVHQRRRGGRPHGSDGLGGGGALPSVAVLHAAGGPGRGCALRHGARAHRRRRPDDG